MGLSRVMLVSVSILAGWGPGRGRTNWPGGVCPAPTDEQRLLGGDDDRVYLFRDGGQVGGWDYEKKIWRDYDAATGRWGAVKSAAPVTPPLRILIGQVHGSVQNMGIDLDKLEEHRQHL